MNHFLFDTQQKGLLNNINIGDMNRVKVIIANWAEFCYIFRFHYFINASQQKKFMIRSNLSCLFCNAKFPVPCEKFQRDNIMQSVAKHFIDKHQKIKDSRCQLLNVMDKFYSGTFSGWNNVYYHSIKKAVMRHKNEFYEGLIQRLKQKQQNNDNKQPEEKTNAALNIYATASQLRFSDDNSDDYSDNLLCNDNVYITGSKDVADDQQDLLPQKLDFSDILYNDQKYIIPNHLSDEMVYEVGGDEQRLLLYYYI